MIRIGKNNIPDPVYEELLQLFGKERTNRLMKRTWCNYYVIIFIIANEKFKGQYKISLYLLFVLIVFLLVLYFYFINNFIY